MKLIHKRDKQNEIEPPISSAWQTDRHGKIVWNFSTSWGQEKMANWRRRTTKETRTAQREKMTAPVWRDCTEEDRETKITYSIRRRPGSCCRLVHSDQTWRITRQFNVMFLLGHHSWEWIKHQASHWACSTGWLAHFYMGNRRCSCLLAIVD